ncbi:MAG TPA: DEAD/DEAH box helicase [Candidatus Norongarragalinales archaeon]|jgi:ATP-dependent RNA helicase DeaD|nr:DEAD/DEAH box helicase [Candidatus Norongarragalinales archaeon]
MTTEHTFDQLKLDERLLRAIHEMGFTTPTPIQAKAIPLALQGSDIIGQAQTGTGKTAAFGLPILQSIDHQKPVVQSLILAPTRELAIQVAEELKQLSKHVHTRIITLYGGQEIQKQLGPLHAGVQIVVGTPGRVLDHLERRSLNLSSVKVVVLDEADRMLDMGFIDDVNRILEKTPREKQTMLFSATMPAPIRRLAEKFMVTPELVKVSEDKLTVTGITQYYMGVDPRDKIDVLQAILKTRAKTQTIAFCRTKHGADRVAEILQRKGFNTLALHGNLTQNARDKVMAKFREGQIQVLVATDLAARGLDVDDVTHVINYDLPEDGNVYLHRIGRTGRAGKAGESITFCGNLLDIRSVKLWAQIAGSTIDAIDIPFEKRIPRNDSAPHGAPQHYGQRHGGGHRPQGHGGYRGGGGHGGGGHGGGHRDGGYRGGGGHGGGGHGGGHRGGGFRHRPR